MKQENVCKKYGITPEDLKEGVDRYSAIATPRWAGDTYVLLAILELLCNGDVEEAEQ